MAIKVMKVYTIKNDVSGEEISVSLLSNGNIKLDLNCSEIQPETFEELIRYGKELIQ